MTALVEQVSRGQGRTRRAIGADEIVERCMYPLVNEGAKILEEGIAARPLDIDMIWIFGYGFPRYRGGPMHYADTVGLANVLADIRAFAKEDPLFWTPSPLIVELVERGADFASLNRVD